jgi:hypothetical protein
MDIEAESESLFSLICSNRALENSEAILRSPEIRDTRFAALFRELAEKGRQQQSDRVRRWLTRANMVLPSALFIQLYNQNAFYSEAIMQAFLRDQDDLPPYPDVLIMAMLSYQMNRLDDVNRALLSRDISDWTLLLEDFVKNEKMPEIIRGLSRPLRYYSGGTHTKLKLYDGYLTRLLPFFNLEAECLADLGGGYATADLNRITKKSFTSLDILSPDIRKGDPENLILRKQVNPWTAVLLTQDERREYIDRQAKIPWINWNVLDNTPLIERLGDHKSYGLTSFGFMSSSVRPLQNLTTATNAKFNVTSKNACRRIIELVALGKDVSLIAIERATMTVREQKAVALRWKDGRLLHYEAMKNPTKNLISKSLLVNSLKGGDHPLEKSNL